jgi:hypothetical protein
MAASMKMVVFWVVTPCSLVEASTSEMSVNFFQTTRHNNPDDSCLHFGTLIPEPGCSCMASYLYLT